MRFCTKPYITEVMFVGVGLMSSAGGKQTHNLREHTVTFGWEVGFALSLVGPVHDQVPVATKAVGDLIYEKWKNKTRGI